VGGGGRRGRSGGPGVCRGPPAGRHAAAGCTGDAGRVAGASTEAPAGSVFSPEAAQPREDGRASVGSMARVVARRAARVAAALAGRVCRVARAVHIEHALPGKGER